MTASRLLASFGSLVEAPEATLRLRRFILDLAVSGRLVHQDPNEEPATSLLARIDEKRANSTAPRNSRSRSGARISAEGVLPYSLPRGWAITSLSNITDCLDSMREP